MLKLKWSFHIVFCKTLIFFGISSLFKYSGSKKSLENVFQMGTCHPKFSMVIDDRLNVWDINDQQRVHVVPPFQPYYSPQAEVLIFLFFDLLMFLSLFRVSA